MEIERKFLLSAVPSEGGFKKESLCMQGYYSFDPEVRFRSKQFIDPKTSEPIGDVKYFATIKSVALKVRDEVEGQITEDFFKHMEEKIGKPFIHKHQFNIEYNGRDVAASIVDEGMPTSFIYSEVEFESEEEMNNFVWPWPSILIKEVSDDPEYYMQNYWRRTRGE